MNKTRLIYISFLFLIQSLFAQQKVISGLTIETTATWSGNIVIEGDVIVAKTGRLIINAGSNISFMPNMDKQRSGKDKTRSELIVYGILIVKGRLDAKVTFSSASANPRMGDWYGIRIMSPKQISVVENCLVEYAFNGLAVKKSNPVIRNSQMSLNYNAGILVEVKAEPKINKNIISENGYAGVITNLGAKPILSDNLIVANQIGIIAFSLSQPNLGNLRDSKKVNQGRNSIFENSEYDVYNHTNLPLLAENNSWGDNTNQSEIALRVYDAKDEAKYGAIDFLPVFKKSNIEEFLEISQPSPEPVLAQTQTTQDNNSNSAQVQNPVNNNPPLSQPVTQTPAISQNRIQQQSIAEPEENEVVEDTNTDNTELLASNDVKPIENLETKSAPPQVNYDQIFLEYFLDTQKGEVVQKFAPQISNSTLGRGAKGQIIVRAVVSKNGLVESAAVIKGLNPYFDQLSVETALKFKYKPGTIKNNPVRFYTNIFFEF
ncbi:MAG: hypothetical protein D8M58_06295 [Calditrichaeota bacterium]|nr:MAG: hypothetical protein DWQ03_20210 [Calditrichota bacterium]MBL1204990.1 hypothetical protein [Calditrichota bacterium]NOG44820.1 hypothetical protein [Calditrichota bacterium]